MDELENDLDGYNNTKRLKSLGVKSPALDYCGKLGEKWYLPSSGELKRLFKNQLGINITLNYLRKPALELAWFWSSTLKSSEYGWGYHSCGEFGLDNGFGDLPLDYYFSVIPFLKNS